MLTTAFYILLVIVSVLVIAGAVERHDSGWGFASALIISGMVVAELFLHDVKPITYLWHNVWSLSLWIVAYLAVGVVYIWIRWFAYVKKAAAYLREHGPDSFRREYDTKFPLQVRDYKNRIIGWGIYWPFSGLALIIDEPIARFFRWVYSSIAGFLQKMSDNAFKGL